MVEQFLCSAHISVRAVNYLSVHALEYLIYPISLYPCFKTCIPNTLTHSVCLCVHMHWWLHIKFNSLSALDNKIILYNISLHIICISVLKCLETTSPLVYIFKRCILILIQRNPTMFFVFLKVTLGFIWWHVAIMSRETQETKAPTIPIQVSQLLNWKLASSVGRML